MYGHCFIDFNVAITKLSNYILNTLGKFIVCGISLGASITGCCQYFAIPFNMVAVAPSTVQRPCGGTVWWTKYADGKNCKTLQVIRKWHDSCAGRITCQRLCLFAIGQDRHWLFRAPFNCRERLHNIFVAAINDAYVPTNTVNMVAKQFKDTCSLRWVLGGHATWSCCTKLIRDVFKCVEDYKNMIIGQGL